MCKFYLEFKTEFNNSYLTKNNLKQEMEEQSYQSSPPNHSIKRDLINGLGRIKLTQ